MNDMSGITNAFPDENGAKPVHAIPRAQYAITVRNARIQYNDGVKALLFGDAVTTNVVLNDFNMSVQKGHIYGLLGASGCGKTSILRAIVGQLDLTAGEIRVLGHRPKSPQSGIPGTTIGYMPQELSLLEESTIKESLYFYGRIAGMSSKEIDEKSKYLIKLLDLPEANRHVGALSGGQRRRVSFAIALVHSPPILILDEPTVGVDPLLRESIWKYLAKVTKEDGITVLITTHYIEEACNADTVGLMRNGELMAEQSPRSLMDVLHCEALEDVLVKLCLRQSSKDRSVSYVNDVLDLTQLQTVDKRVENSETTIVAKKDVSPIQRLQALTWKNAVSFLRHPWFMFFFYSFYVSCAFLFTASFGTTLHDVKISVVNQETNCFSSGLMAPVFHGHRNSNKCEISSFLSCKMLESLQKKSISLVFSESESSAKSDVYKGRTRGLMTLSKNFTSALLERAVFVDGPDDVLDMGTIQVSLDQSDRIVSFFLQEKMYSSMKEVLADANTACSSFRHIKDVPIQFQTPVYGGQTEITDSGVPGVVVGLCFMGAFTAALSTLLPEKISGSLERGLVVGVTMAEVVLSHFVTCFGFSCLVVCLVTIIPYIFFGLVMNGSFWTLAVILFPLTVSAMLFGFVVAVLCGTFTSGSMLGAGFFFSSVFTCGMMWPVEGMYPYLRELCWILPLTLPTEAIRHIAIRGWSLYDSSIQLALASTILWTCVFVAMLLFVLRFKR